MCTECCCPVYCLVCKRVNHTIEHRSDDVYLSLPRENTFFKLQTICPNMELLYLPAQTEGTRANKGPTPRSAIVLSRDKESRRECERFFIIIKFLLLVLLNTSTPAGHPMVTQRHIRQVPSTHARQHAQTPARPHLRLQSVPEWARWER